MSSEAVLAPHSAILLSSAIAQVPSGNTGLGDARTEPINVTREAWRTRLTAIYIGSALVGIVAIMIIVICIDLREEADPFRPRVSQGSSCLAMD